MRFENGMLGFLIVVLAVGGGIAGTVLLSADATTHEVTKYNMVADVTGLFDTDESPQYMDYDLSQNYTGYYTRNTMVNGINYWGGADYVQAKINNYPIRLAPQIDYTGTVKVSNHASNLTISTPPGSDDLNVYYDVDGQPGHDIEDSTLKIIGANSYTLTSLMSELNISTYQYIVIESPSDELNDLIFFTSSDNYQDYRDSLTYDYIGLFISKSFADQYPEYQNLIACLSCKINTTTQKVDLYYGINGNTQTYVRTINLSDACIITGPNANNDTINIHAYDPEKLDYMDISRGVTVTGVTP